jgi:hypothetical protein
MRSKPNASGRHYYLWLTPLPPVMQAQPYFSSQRKNMATITSKLKFSLSLVTAARQEKGGNRIMQHDATESKPRFFSK